MPPGAGQVPGPGRRQSSDHPGMANYADDEFRHRRVRFGPRSDSPRDFGPSANRYLPPLDGERHRYPGEFDDLDDDERSGAERLTRTRAAAMRSREMGSRMYSMVQRAAAADGADKSGLTALTWPVVANFAVDAAMAVALANTLFFSAATGEDKTKVALYLLITIAPFAVIAPLIGPMLDRLQRGRRIALASSFGIRTLLAVILVFNFDSWISARVENFTCIDCVDNCHWGLLKA